MRCKLILIDKKIIFAPFPKESLRFLHKMIYEQLRWRKLYFMHIYSSFFVTSLLALLIMGCSGVAPVTDPSASGSMAGMDHSSMNMESNTAVDAQFIDSMIEHHQGAIDMAEVALEQAEHEELRALAEEIIAAQTTEIEQMQSRRNQWYPDLALAAGMEMEMGDMMISADASEPFDQRFIEAMISHHQGAVGMAKMALDQAEHEEIRTLAGAIIADQESEIARMQGWLTEWYGVSQ
jgi:uncharacterized protein (DUF305 family)